MENIIKNINATTNTYTFGANAIAEALKTVGTEQIAKAEKANNRLSRAARQEKAAKLGVKVVTPVTAKASAKFAAAEEIRKDFEAARKAAKATARAEQMVLDAAWDKVDEATKNPNKGFNSFAIALEKAKAFR